MVTPRPAGSLVGLAILAWHTIVLAGLVACSGVDDDNPERINFAALSPGVVARVGTEELSGNFVVRVAQRHGLVPSEALSRAVSDVVLSEAARTHFAGTGKVETIERSAHSRALLDRLFAQAKEAGPPADEEIDRLKAERWMDLDRPETVRVVHAVAMVEKDQDEAEARALAARIAEATAAVSDAAEFMKLAKTVTSGNPATRVEPLPHMTADGRGVYLDPLDHRREKPARFDPDFARAAHAIPEEGQRSPIVTTGFGYHVILLMERVDAQRYTRDELHQKLEDDVYRLRAKRQLDRLLSDLRSTTTIETTRNVEELTAHVSQRP